MEYPSALPPFQQFILDCADLASSLDDLDLQDPSLDFFAAISDAWKQHDSLLARRRALATSLIEDAWIDFMLDGLRARLSFLEGHTANVLQNVREAPLPPLDPGMLS